MSHVTRGILWLSPSCAVSPGRTQSCPLVATWPEGRGSADPCVPRRPRQTQAPSHSYPAEREETQTDGHRIRYVSDRRGHEEHHSDATGENGRSFGDVPTLPEACPWQEGVRSRSQRRLKRVLLQRHNQVQFRSS